MANQHSQSFFGQNTGIIINSSAKEEQFIYIRCIKKKSNGIWEKPSSKEGRVIKCSLDEIIMFLEVLKKNILKWQCFHTYKQTETSISFSWEDEKAKTLWINIANYSKMLRFAEAEILRLLLTHILKEKIAIHEISKLGNDVTNKSLANYVGVNSNKIPAQFFSRSDYMKEFVNIRKNGRITTYKLTKKGKEAVSLLIYFKKYYKNLIV